MLKPASPAKRSTGPNQVPRDLPGLTPRLVVSRIDSALNLRDVTHSWRQLPADFLPCEHNGLRPASGPDKVRRGYQSDRGTRRLLAHDLFARLGCCYPYDAEGVANYLRARSRRASNIPTPGSWLFRDE